MATGRDGWRRREWTSVRPSVRADEGYEPHRQDINALEVVSSSREHGQHLVLSRPEGDEHAPTLGELIAKRRRNLGRRGAHEYGVVWRVIPPSKRAVTQQQ